MNTRKDATYYVDHPNSVHYTCPACASQPGEPCTTPTDNGQKRVRWYHYSRSALVMDQELPPRAQ